MGTYPGVGTCLGHYQYIRCLVAIYLFLQLLCKLWLIYEVIQESLFEAVMGHA